MIVGMAGVAGALGALLLFVSPLLFVIFFVRRGMPAGGPDAGMHTSSVLAGAMLGGWALASAAGSGLYLALTYQPRVPASIHSGCAWDGVGQFLIGAVVAAPFGVLIGWLALRRWSARGLIAIVALVAAVAWTVVMTRPVLDDDGCGAYQWRASAWHSAQLEGR
jgi:hypothetical protein